MGASFIKTCKSHGNAAKNRGGVGNELQIIILSLLNYALNTEFNMFNIINPFVY